MSTYQRKSSFLISCIFFVLHIYIYSYYLTILFFVLFVSYLVNYYLLLYIYTCIRYSRGVICAKFNNYNLITCTQTDSLCESYMAIGL